MRRRWAGWASKSVLRAALLGMAVVAATAEVNAQSVAETPAAACAANNQSDTAKVGQYKFITYSSEAGECLQVVSGGKVIFQRAVDSFERYTLGQNVGPEHDIPAIANGTDVTGRGKTDMIVSLFTGGAHCCTSHMVFEREPEFKLLATLNDADDDIAHFEQMGADRRYYYLTADWTFAYWPTCFACSPSVLVTLRFVDDAKGGGFHLALDKMRTPAPKPAEWNKELSAVQKAVSADAVDDIGQALWGTVLNLIYGGHSDLAWKFLDEAGPKAQQGDFKSLADFCALLKTSPYWLDLQPSLVDLPAACAGAKPVANK
jgi:hypothetical protein